MKHDGSFLSREQVQEMTAKHGTFQFGDAQGDVSREFAQEAIERYKTVQDAAPELLKALKRLLVIAKLVTVRQVIEAGDEAINAVGLNPWVLNEGLARGDESVDLTFARHAIEEAEDFKKKKEQ